MNRQSGIIMRRLALLTAGMCLLMSTAACSSGNDSGDVIPVDSVPVPTDAPVSSQPEDPPVSSEPEDAPPVSSEDSAPSAEAPETEVIVRPAAWRDVQWTQFECPYFTLNIPEGWTVDWHGNAESLWWQASGPEDTYVGIWNLDHAVLYKSAETANILGQEIYLEDGTVQEYFEKMYSKSTDYFTVQNSCVPANKDELQKLRPDKNIWDYEALYATFAENGKEGEGVYSAAIMEAPDLILTGGINYAMWEINATVGVWAERGRLVDWYPVINQVAMSFTYTDYYWQEWMDRLQTNTHPDQPSNDNDPVMEAFEERMREDTIQQEKTSDMIGEYERVYDNETGEIYRAYLGFIDDFDPDQSRYSYITDDQYADGYVGWIDKPE